jgi:type IV secretory pathway VirB10-like protein
MARPNVIVIGAIILAPAIMAAEGYAIYRTHHRPPRRSVEDAAPIEAVIEQPPAPPARLLATTTTPPPPPARQPETPAPVTPPPDQGTGEGVDPVVVRRQRGLYERRRQVIHEADEQVFDALNLPEAQRAAIRAIDDQYGRTLASIAETSLAANFQDIGIDSNAEQTRRAAIAGVLGPDTVRAFNFAERKAERRVRNHLRPDVVRGN